MVADGGEWSLIEPPKGATGFDSADKGEAAYPLTLHSNRSGCEEPRASLLHGQPMTLASSIIPVEVSTPSSRLKPFYHLPAAMRVDPFRELRSLWRGGNVYPLAAPSIPTNAGRLTR